MAGIIKFPSQKKSTTAKTEKWGQKCIDAALDLNLDSLQSLRATMANKQTNYDLAAGKIDEAEMEKQFNPMDIKNASIPAKIQNHPIEKSKFDLLMGEELSRRFDWNMMVTNDDAVSIKEEQQKKDFTELLQAEMTDPNFDEQQAKKRIEDMQKYFQYDYQDVREVMATRVLNYLDKEQDMKLMFNAGFNDALIAGEEIYCCDIIAGEPIVRRVNPLTLYTLHSGTTNKIEDSDIIVEDKYSSVGNVVDTFYEYLTPREIDKLEIGNDDGDHASGQRKMGDPKFMPFGLMGGLASDETGENLITVDGVNNGNNSGYDAAGNIRVSRVTWKSRRLLKKLKFYDKNGEEQEEIVDENYEPNEDKGEEITKLWVNEWWEGTRIADDIYVKIQPRPVQFRKLSNLSYCHPGYVGTIYNTNSSQAVSMMDRVKPYKYLYNIYSRKLELTINRYHGPIIELDLAKIPNGWTVEKWMHYAENLNYAVVDSFSAAQEGYAKGKLAGHFNTTGKVLNPNLGNFIQQMIMILEKIKNDVAEITGITRQREGAIDNRETVGGVERSVTQSSHITEVYYSLHDNLKLRVYECLLDTAKEAWRYGSKKLDYIDDGIIKTTLQVEGGQFKESEYGIFATNSRADKELRDVMKQWGFAALQADKASLSDIAKMYTDKSMQSILKDLEIMDTQKQQQLQQEQEKQLKAQQEAVQMQEQGKQADRELKERIADKDNATKLQVESMKMADNQIDRDNDGIPDSSEEDRLLSQERMQKDKLNHDSVEADKDRAHESNENSKERSSKEKIAKEKPKVKQNSNK